jgi:hypothetical protein
MPGSRRNELSAVPAGVAHPHVDLAASSISFRMWAISHEGIFRHEDG